MDLVFIKRKYKNIKRNIILSFIITMFIYTFLIINHVYANIEKDKEFSQYQKVYISLKQHEENKLKQEDNNLPIMTEENITKIKNIYKSGEKQVFLTFDDGPSKTVTVPILDLLKQENIKATFFVLGHRAELYPEIVKRAYQEGHYIANHGYSHKYNKIYDSELAVLEEYHKANDAIKNAIGNQEYNTGIFRFPGGSIGGKYDKIKSKAKILLEQNNIATVDWNALTGDTEGLKNEEDLLNRLRETAQGKNSIIILMHDAGDKKYTYEVLSKVIEYLRQEGYEFKNFYDIIE